MTSSKTGGDKVYTVVGDWQLGLRCDNCKEDLTYEQLFCAVCPYCGNMAELHGHSTTNKRFMAIPFIRYSYRYKRTYKKGWFYSVLIDEVKEVKEGIG